MQVLCPTCQTTFEQGEETVLTAVRCPTCGQTIPPSAELSLGRPQPTDSSVLLIGQMVSHYRVLERLGGGGMGVVYKAQDSRLGRKVALKFVSDRRAHEPQAVERFRREGRTASDLNHPHICTIYDVGEHDGRPFIVMELLEGKTLFQRLAGQPLAADEWLDLAIQIVSALEAAHSRGVVHRDIKPSNIFLTAHGLAKVLDFGLAKLLGAEGGGNAQPSAPTVSDEDQVSSPGTVVGTVAYMSPEQARGQALDARSDLFSFGVVLYEMATGQAPFQGSTTAIRFDALLNKEPVPPHELNAGVLAGAEPIILKTLEKDRDLRYQTAGDLRADLIRLRRDVESGRIRAAEAAAVTVRRRRGWLVGVAAALVLVGFGWWLFSWLLPGRPGLVRMPRVTPFLTGAVIRKDPAWSPTGNLIAYVSDEAGRDDIWICDPSGANPINLTGRLHGPSGHPAWAPHGDQIAFLSDHDGTGVYVMPALGGAPHKIASLQPAVWTDFSLQWATDDHVICTDSDDAGQPQVYEVSLKGGPRRCLTTIVGAVSGHDGCLSPGGRFLAFNGPDSASAALYIGDLVAGNAHRLDGNADQPRWGPSGDQLYFSSDREGVVDLWMLPINARTGAPRDAPHRVTSGFSLNGYAVSGDGQHVLAVKGQDHRRLWTFLIKQRGPLTRLADGEPLTPPAITDADPAWTPNGKNILFASDRRGTYDIWRIHRDGTGLVRLIGGPGSRDDPKLSPNGRWLVYSQEDGDGWRLRLSREDGSDSHRIESNPADTIVPTGAPCWSNTSQLVFVGRAPDGHLAIGTLQVDPQTGATHPARVLDLPGGTPRAPRWSPDGHLLAYRAIKGGVWHVWITDARGRDAHRLTTSNDNEGEPVWSADGRWVFYRKEPGSIWRVGVNGDGRAHERPQLWARFPHIKLQPRSLDLCRDRAVIAITEESRDLWMVDLPER